jgi:hypothetical protein
MICAGIRFTMYLKEDLKMRVLLALTIIWSHFHAAVSATNNGLTDLIEWDEYSLTVNDSRLFILLVCPPIRVMG